ncbi:MAG: hypothetical protein IKP66_02530, partial [Lachnospiraceae bacterium]|nr:hypothetical protein [Lachnospiraceae bacterium]
MFSLNKRFVAILLIFAMTISNAGMSTLAVSISHYVDSANQNAKDDSDITYRYYEEYRYSYESRTTLLMNNDSEDELKEDVEENETEYAEELEEDESEMSESEESESEESESEESESEESESETSESETSESETDESIESEESTTAAEEPTEQSEEETTTTHSEESTHSSEIEEPDIASASDIEVNEETLEPMMEDEIEIAISSEVGEKLFGTTGGTHTHKVCGLSAQPCTHIDMASHTENIEWEEFPTSIAASQVNDYLNGTTGNLGQYIFLSDDLTLTDNAISARRDIYICLNGHSIIGGFADSRYKVVITNCQNSVGTICNIDNNYIFAPVNAEVYGLEFSGVKNINIKGSRYINANVNSAKNIYIYNAKFVKYESSSGNSYSAISIGNYTGKKTLTLEKVEFEGSSNTNYRNPYLVDIDGDNDNSILNLRDITINNYNSVEDCFINMFGGTVTFNGENTISNSKNSTGVIYLGMGILNVASGKTTIKGNTINGDQIVTAYNNSASFTVEKGATFNIEDNKVNFSNNHQEVILFNRNTKLLGNVNIVNNKVVSASGTSTRIYSAVRLGASSNITVGTGSIVIKNNGIYSDAAGTTKYNGIKYYELYSQATDNSTAIFVQNAGTKFSKDSFIDGIAFAHANGFGIIMKNWTTNAEDPDGFTSKLLADTYNRSTLKTVMDGDDLVINDGYFVEFMYDAVTYAGIATQSIIVNGKVSKVASPSDPTGQGGEFFGWATKPNARKKDVINFDTFVITKDTKLYATFEKIHIHKVCGLSTQSCTHIDMASHSKSVRWEEFPTDITASQVNNYLNGTSGGLGQYIFLSNDLTLTGNTITLSRDIYICLNGHSIIGTFAASTYKVVITNCKNSVGTIGNFNSTVFTALNAEVYGLEFGGVKNINIKGSRYIDANVNSAKNIYIYNAKFVKYESNSGNYQDAIYIANSTGKKIVTLEKVEFEGSSNTNYKNDCLIELDGNNDNSILNLRDITINNYNSVESYFISVGYGTVTLNGENTISNSKNILSSSTTGGLIYANYGTVNV